MKTTPTYRFAMKLRGTDNFILSSHGRQYNSITQDITKIQGLPKYLAIQFRERLIKTNMYSKEIIELVCIKTTTVIDDSFDATETEKASDRYISISEHLSGHKIRKNVTNILKKHTAFNYRYIIISGSEIVKTTLKDYVKDFIYTKNCAMFSSLEDVALFKLYTNSKIILIFDFEENVCLA